MMINWYVKINDKKFQEKTNYIQLVDMNPIIID